MTTENYNAGTGIYQSSYDELCGRKEMQAVFDGKMDEETLRLPKSLEAFSELYQEHWEIFNNAKLPNTCPTAPSFGQQQRYDIAFQRAVDTVHYTMKDADHPDSAGFVEIVRERLEDKMEAACKDLGIAVKDWKSVDWQK